MTTPKEGTLSESGSNTGLDRIEIALTVITTLLIAVSILLAAVMTTTQASSAAAAASVEQSAELFEYFPSGYANQANGVEEHIQAY